MIEALTKFLVVFDLALSCIYRSAFVKIQAVKINGFVNGTPDFADQALVLNGTSDLIFEVFEEKGKHARAAVGCVGLPLGSSVEVDAVFEIA